MYSLFMSNGNALARNILSAIMCVLPSGSFSVRRAGAFSARSFSSPSFGRTFRVRFVLLFSALHVRRVRRALFLLRPVVRDLNDGVDSDESVFLSDPAVVPAEIYYPCDIAENGLRPDDIVPVLFIHKIYPRFRFAKASFLGEIGRAFLTAPPRAGGGEKALSRFRVKNPRYASMPIFLSA